ncbi:hypothetical protein THAOC_06291 [Thalassiosira oceanica]|uniref:Uncharacterized protein n=1 Tax=Thalassiosira oceanica TaxID=159749 RepID=K0T0S5_THAOC|nr:hypothetical protein THAOC_06291 [Thalassiosira oceanica]|eukprot:EJK72198.1 hypothetical protein THAOC_06291 [Thalassiosira oceanica]
MYAASAWASGPIRSSSRAGIPSARTASENAREVKQFEEEYGEDWDGTMIEYDSDFVDLPKYVGQALLKGNIRTVLQWLGKGKVRERVNAKWEDGGNAGLLFFAVMKKQLDLMSYLLLNGADVNILNVGGASVLTSSCFLADSPLEAIRLLLSWGAEHIESGKQMTKERKLSFCHETSSRGHVKIANLMLSELGGRRCEIISAPKTRDDLVGKTCMAEEYIEISDQYKVRMEFTNEVLLLGTDHLKRRDRTPQDPGYYVECKNNRLKRRDFKSNAECRAIVVSLREDVEESSEADPDAEAKAEQAAADLLSELGLGDIEGQSSSAMKKEKQPAASDKKKKRGGKKKRRYRRTNVRYGVDAAGDEANEENLNLLENFLNDDSNVSPTSRFTYVIMLAESIRTDGVELKSIEPYSLLVAKKKTGWGERKFSANKDMYAMDIKRRDPTAKINKKSKSIKALREMPRALPLSAADRQFVIKEEAQARECVKEMLGPDDENGGSGIITETDKLRYIVLFCSDEVIAAYLRAQRVLEGGPNGELSLRNHAERQPEWYNMSGNGSDMRVLNDVDSDCEEVEKLEKAGLDNRSRMSEGTYERFNKAHAIARATKIGDDDLVMMDGDDRQSFLQGQPVSPLYWWHMFDLHTLLFRTVAILDANTGVSSDTLPRQALAQGVKDSVASINRLTQAQLLSQQTNLERERYTVELQKFAPHFAGNPAAIASIERRIAQIDSQLADVAKLLHPESNEGNST